MINEYWNIIIDAGKLRVPKGYGLQGQRRVHSG